MKWTKNTTGRWRKEISWAFIGALLGAAAGYLYWKNIGCISGTCAIWTNPFRATAYGALLGALVLWAIVPPARRAKKD